MLVGGAFAVAAVQAQDCQSLGPLGTEELRERARQALQQHCVPADASLALLCALKAGPSDRVEAERFLKLAAALSLVAVRCLAANARWPFTYNDVLASLAAVRTSNQTFVRGAPAQPAPEQCWTKLPACTVGGELARLEGDDVQDALGVKLATDRASPLQGSAATGRPLHWALPIGSQLRVTGPRGFFRQQGQIACCIHPHPRFESR